MLTPLVRNSLQTSPKQKQDNISPVSYDETPAAKEGQDNSFEKQREEGMIVSSENNQKESKTESTLNNDEREIYLKTGNTKTLGNHGNLNESGEHGNPDQGLVSSEQNTKATDGNMPTHIDTTATGDNRGGVILFS